MTRVTPALAILAALLAAVLALVAVEFGKGAAEEPGPKILHALTEDAKHGVVDLSLATGEFSADRDGARQV